MVSVVGVFEKEAIPLRAKEARSGATGERVRDHVRHLVHFVAADSHSAALYLRTSSFFTLRNISW
jgi:hypothetical protein